MSSARGIVVVIAVIAAGGASVAAIRQREHNKQILWAMYSDLHNIAAAQEAYFADNASYAMNVDANGGRATNGSVVHILTASATGWTARATHPQTLKVCSTGKTRGESWTQPVCK